MTVLVFFIILDQPLYISFKIRDFLFDYNPDSFYIYTYM